MIARPKSELLTWPARRDGRSLLVAVKPPLKRDGRGFSPVEVSPAAVEGEPSRGAVSGLVAALTRARDVGGIVAIQGFAAPRPGSAPLTFVLAISLAEVPYPEAAELPERNVVPFELPCGTGVRLQRLARAQVGPGQPPIDLFTATYLAPTDAGVLALAFATPHLDGAPEFALLFDAIARSCTVAGLQSASGGPAT